MRGWFGEVVRGWLLGCFAGGWLGGLVRERGGSSRVWMWEGG